MNIQQGAVGGLLALSALSGCGSEATGSAQSPSYESPEQVSQTIERSLERLRALRTVEISDLVLDLPTEARACYGVCEGWEERYHAERARQAPRVASLAALAEAAAAETSLVTRTRSEADAALQALADLEIVEVTGLVEAEPANNPQCYNLPCPEDIAAADQINAAHVSQVYAIVDAAKQSGL